MNNLTVFMLELGLCLSLSALVVASLRTVLVPLLVDLCGTSTRAAFWARFTYLMLFITPLLLVVQGTHSLDLTPVDALRLLRDGLRHVLLGLFLGLAGLGLAIRRYIPAAAPAAASPQGAA